jgi:hypothetical protein
MAAYKEPSFEERAALSRKAREKALSKLGSKPKLDEAELARRKAAQAEREAAAAEKSAARKAAIAQAKAEKQAAANVPKPTEAELKAARDEKYAARKARKK